MFVWLVCLQSKQVKRFREEDEEEERSILPVSKRLNYEFMPTESQIVSFIQMCRREVEEQERQQQQLKQTVSIPSVA